MTSLTFADDTHVLATPMEIVVRRCVRIESVAIDRLFRGTRSLRLCFLKRRGRYFVFYFLLVSTFQGTRVIKVDGSV